jgi:hypothetical protein
MSTNEREPDVSVLIAERDRPSPRHPCELTADRLVDHEQRYSAHLTPAELAAINLTVMALAQVGPREAAARRAGVDHG